MRRALCIVILGVTAIATGWWFLSRPGPRQIDALLRSATQAADRGDDQRAIQLFDQFLGLVPAHAKALLYRGQLARNTGDNVAARKYWAQVGDEPAREGGTARFLEGTLDLESNRTRDAEAAFLKAIELNPSYLQPHERLLKLYAMQLRPAETRRELDAIRKFRPWSIDELYVLINHNGRAVNTAQGIPQAEAFAKADSEDWLSRAALGRLYLWDERYQDSAEILRQVTVNVPDNLAARAWLAEALLGQLDVEGARKVLERIPAGAGSPQAVWRSHGLYWLSVGDVDQAATCLKQAVTLDPNDVPAIYKLGQVLEKQHDLDASQRQFQRVSQLEEMQAALWIVVQGKGGDAEFPLAAVIDTGSLLMKLDRPSDAIPLFELAMSVQGDAPSIRRDLARAATRLEELNAERLKGDVTAAASAPRSRVPATSPGRPSHSLNPADGQIPAVLFADRHVETGLEFQFFNGEAGLKYLLETTGGGVGVLDYDGDGWPDLHFPQGCKLPVDLTDATYSDRLFRNSSGTAFTDVTAAAGLQDRQFGQACAAGDFDNDGFIDLAVANYGTNVLYHNNGDGTFTDITAASGIRGEHWSTSLGWGDLNQDGDLDLYVVNYVSESFRVCRKPDGTPITCQPQVFAAEDDILYLSRGDGSFEDVTKTVGLLAPAGKGLGVVIADLDDDGWPDVYVANDGTPNFLFRNLGNQKPGEEPQSAGVKFAEIGLASGTALSSTGESQASMGIACADFDENGRPDLFVTNFYRETNALYINRGGMSFQDETVSSLLAEPSRMMLGFGTQAVDADLDGRHDLFVLNGHVYDERESGIPWKMPPQFFYNRGNRQFAEISPTSGQFFQQKTLGRGLARLDWNLDGRPDLVAVHQDCPAALLENQSPQVGNFVGLTLRGVRSNRDGIGAKLQFSFSGKNYTSAIYSGDGYGVSNDHRQIIGLGAEAKVDVLEVHWPSGQIDRWTDLGANREFILIEGRHPL